MGSFQYYLVTYAELTTAFIDQPEPDPPIYGQGEGAGFVHFVDGQWRVESQLRLTSYCWLEGVDVCDANTPLGDYLLTPHVVLDSREGGISYTGIRTCQALDDAPLAVCDQLTENSAFPVWQGDDDIPVSFFERFRITLPADPFYLTLNYSAVPTIADDATADDDE